MSKYLNLLFITLLLSCNANQEHAGSKQNFKATLKSNPPVNYNFDRYITHSLEPVRQWQAQYPSAYLYVANRYLIGYDRGNQHILVYDSAHNLSTYGQYGMGPDEIADAFYFRLDSDTTYLIFDLQKQRLVRFSRDNKVLEALNFNNSHISFVDYLGMSPVTNRFIIFHARQEQYYLSYINFPSGQVIASYEIHSVIPTIGQAFDYDLVVEGEFHVNDRYTVYHFYKAGYFLVFDKSTNKPQLYRTIDQTDFPRAVKLPRGDGGYTYSTQPEFIIFPSGTISRRYLYLLSNLQAGHKRAIDIYQLDSGAYVGSIDVPNLADGQRPDIIAVSHDDNQLFIQYEDLVIGEYRLNTILNP